MSIFYSNMSNVLNQWSDFRVSRNLYKEYFALQESGSDDSSGSYIEKLINESTKKLSPVNDKLNGLATDVTEAADKLKAGFEISEENGEIDYDAAYASADSFLNTFNKFTAGISDSGNQTVSGKSELISNMTNAYTYKLSKVGVSINHDGTLSLDKDKFMTASSRDLEGIFGEKDSFASYMSNQAEQLAAYAKTDAYQQANSYSSAGQITNIANMNGSFLNMLG